jgi:chromosome segregation ATPase
MRNYRCRVVVMTVLLLSASGSLFGADSNVRESREREMLRRAQEALRESQAENAQLEAQKAQAAEQADVKLKAATTQLDSARRASRAAQAALQAQLDDAGSARADLSRKLADANQQIALLTRQQQDTASQLKQTQQQLDASKASDASCQAKNLKLYEYSQELVTRYQKKGVWAALTQKEPVTGLKEVGVENVVQEYQEKLAKQKIAQPTPP